MSVAESPSSGMGRRGGGGGYGNCLAMSKRFDVNIYQRFPIWKCGLVSLLSFDGDIPIKVKRV